MRHRIAAQGRGEIDVHCVVEMLFAREVLVVVVLLCFDFSRPTARKASYACHALHDATQAS